MRKTGKVMRLKMPKTTRKPKSPDTKIEERLDASVQLLHKGMLVRTLPSTILCINTMLHKTVMVSIEFEKVWVWYVHVT